MLQQPFGHIPGGSGRAAGLEEMFHVGTGGGREAGHGGFRQRVAQKREGVAEAGAVIRTGHQRAPSFGGGGQLAVEIGRVAAGIELYFGVLLEKCHHLRCGFQIGIDQRRVEFVAGDLPDIGFGTAGRFLPACADGVRRTGYPEPAAGIGGGTAEYRRFLGHNHVQATMGGRYRRRQPAGAGADHQHVAVERLLFEHGMPRWEKFGGKRPRRNAAAGRSMPV